DDPGRDGFEILARDTAEPRWTVLQEAPAPGSYALTLPIDNEFFAVRSVAKTGIRSIAVDAKAVVKKK
ncbi:MAG TPA: hypothetical protein VG777_03785, partial [Thermoanaerobaculia bacterium]|nr:hypothetical protein [Thermoanaerobaculia bacterium]